MFGFIHVLVYIFCPILILKGCFACFPITPTNTTKPSSFRPFVSNCVYFWYPNVTYNNQVHPWTYYNGSWYNQYGEKIPAYTNIIITVPKVIIRTNGTNDTNLTTTPKVTTTTTEYPYWFETTASPFDPGWFNSVELTFYNRMYELRGILHYHWPRWSIFQFKNLTPKISFLRHDRYFEGPINYGLFFLAFATISMILIIAYLLSIRCWGITYPYLSMPILRTAMIIVASLLIFFLLIGLCGHLMIWRCYHVIYVECIAGPNKHLSTFIDRVGDCVDAVFDYIRVLEKKLRFIKASQEGEVNPYLVPDDMLITTTIGPNLKHDMQHGGWAAVYDRIMGVNKDKSGVDWQKVAASVSANVWGITNDLKLMADNALEYLMEHVYEKMAMLEPPIKDFLVDIKTTLYLTKWFTRIDYALSTIGFIFFGYMIFLCFCIIRTTTKHKNRKMRCLSKFIIGMMIIWWLLTMTVIPIAFIWVDLCFHPANSVSDLIAEMVHTFEGEGENKLRLDRELVYHYLTCKGSDPLKSNMKIIILGLGYVTRALGIMLAGIQSFGRNSERVANIDEGTGLMMQIQHAQLEIFKTINAGCSTSALLFKRALIEVCNPCLMGLILFATIAPFISALFLVIAILAIRMKNFIGLPIPGMDWTKIAQKQEMRKQKWLKKQEKKVRRLKEKDDRLRQKMADKVMKKAVKAELDRKLHPVKYIKKKRKLLKKKREREIKRLKKLAACFCVPPFMTGRKCPDECVALPTDLPPVSDPRIRQLELKKLIEADKNSMKEDLRNAKMTLAYEKDAFIQQRRQIKKQAKEDKNAEQKLKKKAKNRLKKMKEADDGDVDNIEEDEKDEEEQRQLMEASKKCDAKCRGIDKLRIMREQKMKAKLNRMQGPSRKHKKADDAINTTGCLEDQCIRSQHAHFELDRAIQNDATTVDLECGCKFGVKELKRRTKGLWSSAPPPM